jgi:ankyrin repeat protein
MVAPLLIDGEGDLCLADFNSFLKVNRALYSCLNRTLWQAAVESTSTTDRVFTHLILTNDLASLKFFLELGADIETLLDELDSIAIFTPLQAAVHLDNVPMARLFLEHGAELVQSNSDGRLIYSAIHAARSAEMVQLLLDHHADPEQQVFYNGYRPLHYYTMRGNLEAMQALLLHGVDVDPIPLVSLSTPLNYAAQHNIDAVKLLLKHGANVKSADPPLHTAVGAGKTDVVKLFLERCPEGTSVKAENGETALHFAAKAGKIDMVRLMLQFWSGGIRQKDNDGNTPLHSSVFCGRTEVARLLVECWPAGVREKNRWGNTPLHLAVEKGKADVVRLLVESWPEGKEALNEHGQTPLSVFENYICTHGSWFTIGRRLLLC